MNNKKWTLQFVLALLIFGNSCAQSLSKERIDKIKNCTVRIIIDKGESMGTGFFIDSIGTVLTCYHVIEPAIVKDSLNRLKNLKKIFIIRNSGDTSEIGFSKYFLEQGQGEAAAFDFFQLNQLKNVKTPFLKFGDFNSVEEGQDIYTCGFPALLERPIITKGMISTKYVERLNTINKNGIDIRMPRDQALLDLTLNPGNSGGPIIKIGKTIEDDEVIGLADFIVNSIPGQEYLNVMNILKKGIGKNRTQDYDLNLALIYLMEKIARLSIGVSGCVSTSHFLTAQSNMKK